MIAPRVIVALDFPDAATARSLAGRLTPELCRLKVGKELFTAAGPALVESLVARGFSVFLDLKFHDIPNTVAHACRSAAALGVWMLNVHALGGRSMLVAAREALGNGTDRPLLIAVTILTSMTAADLREVGMTGGPKEAAVLLARLAQASGTDGVVCSPLEAEFLRSQCGEDFLLVTPGIRPVWEEEARRTSSTDDQQRVATPRAALLAGASYLVIGRPITRAADPLGALRRIHNEIGTLQND